MNFSVFLVPIKAADLLVEISGTKFSGAASTSA